MKRVLSLLSIFLPALAAAQAPGRFLVADSSSSGTYHQMVTEISEYCSGDGTGLEIQELPQKGGATDNLDALVKNRASAAFLHSDVIYAMAQSEPKYHELKTLVALYPEEIHVIALADSGIREGLLRNKVTFGTLADLQGRTVAAAGGGCLTAGILTGQGQAGFTVACKNSGKEVLPALDSGEAQAAIFVGGAPLANLEQLPAGKYKLLSIPESVAGRLGGVYKSATITYPNLGQGNVKTLAPWAIMLTRKYTKPQMIAPQAAFRACFYAHLADLQETPGKHPKWQAVDPDGKGVWDWYDIPTATAAPASAPKSRR